MDMNAAPEMIPKVSVVIPVYNVERYLDRCVQSVLRQTLTDIEIILVDDGSPDRCGEMCDEYAAQDPRVRVIHKANGGLSDARNAGIRIARTDYIGFVDSDDYIDEDMYEILYAAMTKEAADLACCGTINHYQNHMKPAYVDVSGYFVTDASKAIEWVFAGKMASVSVCNKLFKRSLLLSNLFPVGKTSEDAHVIVPYLAYCNTVVFHLLPKYHYIHRKDTITTKPYQKSDNSIIEAWGNNRVIIRNHYPALVNLANFRYYWALFYVFDKMMCTKEPPDMRSFLADKQRLKQEIKENYSFIIRNQYVGKARKIAVKGLMIHETLYKICLDLYNKKHRQWFE